MLNAERNILIITQLCEIRRPTWNVNNPSPNSFSLEVYQFIGLLVYGLKGESV